MRAPRWPYGEDLAFVSDVGFGGLAREAAPGVLAIQVQAGIRSGRVVDLGCGSGIWAECLVAHGYQVLGIDISEAMIRRARRIATFREVGRLYRRSDETHRLRLYPALDVLRELGLRGLTR